MSVLAYNDGPEAVAHVTADVPSLCSGHGMAHGSACQDSLTLNICPPACLLVFHSLVASRMGRIGRDLVTITL